jgi:phosphotransferase system  glucose/maltose/N-acetylglucosamine-specific IIC component
MSQLGWALIVAGAVLIIVGGIMVFAPNFSWLGKLPGDLRFQRGNLEVFIPVTTSLLISGVVTGILWLVRWLRHPG